MYSYTLPSGHVVTSMTLEEYRLKKRSKIKWADYIKNKKNGVRKRKYDKS